MNSCFILLFPGSFFILQSILIASNLVARIGQFKTRKGNISDLFRFPKNDDEKIYLLCFWVILFCSWVNKPCFNLNPITKSCQTSNSKTIQIITLSLNVTPTPFTTAPQPIRWTAIRTRSNHRRPTLYILPQHLPLQILSPNPQTHPQYRPLLLLFGRLHVQYNTINR